MKLLSEYEVRQLLLIKRRINLFEADKLDLFDLVNDLGGLLNVFESISVSWIDDFQIEINNCNSSDTLLDWYSKSCEI
jgi:hypothetical protein